MKFDVNQKGDFLCENAPVVACDTALPSVPERPAADDPPLPYNIPDLVDLLPLLLGSDDETPDGCDVDVYLTKLDGVLDVDEAAKYELIYFLWQTLETLIGIQFGLDPASTAKRAQMRRSSRSTHNVLESKCHGSEDSLIRDATCRKG